MPSPNRLPLPHEFAFNLFLLVVALRCAGIGAFLGAGSFLALVVVGVALAIWTVQRPTSLRWRLRLLWYPVAMGLSFYLLPWAIALLQVPRADALLSAADAALLGDQAGALLLPLATPALTDLMTLGYVFFFYYLICGPAHYFFRDLALLRACFAGMFVIYALGFSGYLLWPAGGPHLAVRFAADLPLGAIARVVRSFIDTASNGVDVFPSIHAAISLYLLLFDWRNFRARFWRMLMPTTILWVSTVYLRYHYAVDLIAGFAVCLVGWWVARRYQFSAQARAIDAAGMETDDGRALMPRPG
jgi:hypothetical protein